MNITWIKSLLIKDSQNTDNTSKVVDHLIQPLLYTYIIIIIINIYGYSFVYESYINILVVDNTLKRLLKTVNLIRVVSHGIIIIIIIITIMNNPWSQS
jgi:hypothetical protein